MKIDMIDSAYFCGINNVADVVEITDSICAKTKE